MFFLYFVGFYRALKDCFSYLDVPTKKRSLKKTAIPSQKIPQSGVDKYVENLKKKSNAASNERRNRYSLRQAKGVIGAEMEVDTIDEVSGDGQQLALDGNEKIRLLNLVDGGENSQDR